MDVGQEEMAITPKNLASRASTCDYGSKTSQQIRVPVLTVPVYKLREQGINATNVYRVDAENSPRPCSTEVRRQTYFVSTDKMLATEAFKDSDSDRLPVVELKPFRQKEWRPSKSLPDWERRALQNLRSATSTQSLDFESAGFPNPDKQLTITPRIPNGPCPKAFVTQAERKTLHPTIKDTRDIVHGSEKGNERDHERQTEHPEGFVSKLEREKSTMGEVRSGSNVCTQFSCSKKALTDMDKQNQQAIHVNGTKLDSGPTRSSSLYFSIPEYYTMKRSYTFGGSNTPERGTQSQLQVLENLQLHVDGVETAYLDDAIYDAFDRSSTLPSIRVKKAHMKKRKPVHLVEKPSSSASNQRSASRRSYRPIYRLGVTNSLDLMKHIGKPVDVEHKLSHELRLNLHNIRKNKESGSIVSATYKINSRFEHVPNLEEARRYSGHRHHPTRTSIESRHNFLHNKPTHSMSRTSGHVKSENLDSGFESAGFRSPNKPTSSVYSPTFHLTTKSSERDTTVTANLHTDIRDDNPSDMAYSSVDMPRAAHNSVDDENNSSPTLSKSIHPESSAEPKTSSGDDSAPADRRKSPKSEGVAMMIDHIGDTDRNLIPQVTDNNISKSYATNGITIPSSAESLEVEQDALDTQEVVGTTDMSSVNDIHEVQEDQHPNTVAVIDTDCSSEPVRPEDTASITGENSDESTRPDHPENIDGESPGKSERPSQAQGETANTSVPHQAASVGNALNIDSVADAGYNADSGVATLDSEHDQTKTETDKEHQQERDISQSEG